MLYESFLCLVMQFWCLIPFSVSHTARNKCMTRRPWVWWYFSCKYWLSKFTWLVLTCNRMKRQPSILFPPSDRNTSEITYGTLAYCSKYLFFSGLILSKAASLVPNNSLYGSMTRTSGYHFDFAKFSDMKASIQFTSGHNSSQLSQCRQCFHPSGETISISIKRLLN